MNKKTELVKSIALAFLVCLSVVLFANSWMREWESSEGKEGNLIDRFIFAIGQGRVFGDDAVKADGSEIIAPSSVILTSGAKRVILNKGTEMYNSCYGDILSVLLCLSGEANAEEVSSAQWYSAFKTQGIFLNYGISVKKSVFENALGLTLPEPVSEVTSLLLTSNDSVTNKLVFYFYNNNGSEKYYKLQTGKSAREIQNILSSADGYTNIPIAAELGFDTSSGESAQAVINGNTVIDLEGGSVKNIEYLPVSANFDSLDNRSLNELLSCFGMSKSSAKQYADSRGIMYIDALGTLRSYAENSCAVIEFTAANSQKGKAFTQQNADPMLSAVCGCYSLACTVEEIYGINGLTPGISSDLNENSTKDSVTTVYADFLANGVPVYVSDNSNVTHSIEMKFNGTGELIYYKQYLFDIYVKENAEQISLSPVLNAVNNVYSVSDRSGKAMKVSDIFKCYRIGGGKTSAVWSVRFVGNDDIYTVS